MPTDTIPVWTTKDGRTLQLPSIDDEHLGNIIRMIERNAAFYSIKVMLRILELVPASSCPYGEEAYYEQLVESTKERYHRYFREHHVYFHLLAEAERRGLTINAPTYGVALS